MAGELQVRAATGGTMYAQIRSTTGTIWNGTAFEAYLTANIATYAVSMTEQGTASQMYVGDFPAAITEGMYHVSYWSQAGGGPAEADTFVASEGGAWGAWVEWSGSVRLPRSAWALVSVADVGEGREWVVEANGRIGPTIIIAATDSVTLSMDFSRFFNKETSFSTADSVVDQSGNGLSTSGLVLSGDRKKIFFDVAAADLAVATNYIMRVTGTTSDGNVISGDGTLQTRA